jgi:hypothetical protein
MCCAFRPLQHSQWTQNDVTSQAFSNEKHAALDTGTRTLFCCLFAFMLFGLFRFFRVFVFFFCSSFRTLQKKRLLATAP